MIKIILQDSYMNGKEISDLQTHLQDLFLCHFNVTLKGEDVVYEEATR